MQETLISRTCKIIDLGCIDYEIAYQQQKQAVNDVIAGGENRLFICEHPPVFTLGRLACEDNFLLSPSDIEHKGVCIRKVDRGGEVTFHGPGQLVVYPIVRLDFMGRDLKRYMNGLEQVAIDLLRHFGIVANRIQGLRGIWVGKKKIASIGIGVRKWVSFHGMALNVMTDMSYFRMIKPCGLSVQMTSMRDVACQDVNMNRVKNILIECFCHTFDLVRIERRSFI